MRKIKYIVTFTPRSGSTHFCALIGSHYQAVCYGEMLNDSRRKFYVDFGVGRVLEHFFFTSGIVTAAGGKIARGHTNKEPWQKQAWDMIRSDEKIRVIHLVRRNKLRQYISSLWWDVHREISGRKHKAVAAELIKKKVKRSRLVICGPIHVDITAALRHMERRETEEVELAIDFVDRKTLTVVYEDLCENEDAVMLRVRDYLGIDNTVPCYSGYKKLNSLSIEDAIENYDEVRKALSKTKWGHCLQ